METTKIKVEVLIDAPLSKAWECWTSPDHIIRWYAASDDWHTPRATNDVKVGGGFNFRMEARNKNAGFDFLGSYTSVSPQEHLHCLLGDGRHVDIRFLREANLVRIVEEFETEATNPPEIQRKGWQAILNNFKKYVEAT